MKSLLIDVETTTKNNGHPFTPDNKLVYVGYRQPIDGNVLLPVEYHYGPYGSRLKKLQKAIDDAELLIGFNFKFDLHWLRRYGLVYSTKKLWDLQYAEFCISGQTWPYPSLDEACTKRGIKGKLSSIEEKYWSKGIDTLAIPEPELREYLEQDLNSSWELFQAQIAYLSDKPQLKRLIWTGSQDILVTEEMEWNGLKYDHQKSLRKGNELLGRVAQIEAELQELGGCPHILWTSPADISAVLYGGKIKYDDTEEFTFTYKDGHTKQKVRKVVREIVLPRLVEPLKGTKSSNEAKEQWGTDEGTLQKLKATGKAQEIVTRLLEMRGLNKQVGTYYHGFPSISQELGWTNNFLHGQLNHCRATTGRLSSNKPNMQNMDDGVRECVISRFPLKKS